MNSRRVSQAARFLTHKPPPEESAIIRLAMLVTGGLSVLGGMIALVQFNWVGLILLPFGGVMLFGFWHVRKTAKANKAAEQYHWPQRVPVLYPDLDGLSLCQFLSEPQFKAIGRFQIIDICPFASRDRSDEENMFGVGLARLMIRDLMLLPNISVRGPEDSLNAYRDSVHRHAERATREVYVTGEIVMAADNVTLNVDILQPGQPPIEFSIQDNNFTNFVLSAAEEIAKRLGGRVDDTIKERWTFTRPMRPETLLELGQLRTNYKDDESRERSEKAIKLFEQEPTFSLFLGEVDSTEMGTDEWDFKALEVDPYDAQMCFALFCNVCSGDGSFDPAAVQYIRRAVEVSPGHGKAHMVAPHAAHYEADMLPHSELGYRLLPGNSFAINNYIGNLERAGAPTEQIAQLVNEAIDCDPNNPSSHFKLISLYEQAKDWQAALNAAERLQQLFEPEMNERALYCLKQNPSVAAEIESGAWDPVAENRARIEHYRKKLS